MANFYNFDGSAGFFSLVTPDPASFKHIFNITQNNLEYSFVHVEDNNKVLCNISLSLEVLKSHNRYCSQSFWAFDDNGALGVSTDLYTITRTNQLVSILDNTKITKSSNLFLHGDGQSVIPFRIFVNDKDGDFTTFSYFVYSPDPTNGTDIGHTTTVVTNVGEAPTGFTKWKTIIAPITLSTTQTTAKAGDVITVNVTTTDTDLDKIYLEQITGVLDRTVVSLTNGSGSFNILTNTLVTGDTVEVKAGHKLFTGVSTFTQTLV